MVSEGMGGLARDSGGVAEAARRTGRIRELYMWARDLPIYVGVGGGAAAIMADQLDPRAIGFLRTRLGARVHLGGRDLVLIELQLDIGDGALDARLGIGVAGW